jgi:hypothetical protein
LKLILQWSFVWLATGVCLQLLAGLEYVFSDIPFFISVPLLEMSAFLNKLKQQRTSKFADLFTSSSVKITARSKKLFAIQMVDKFLCMNFRNKEFYSKSRMNSPRMVFHFRCRNPK